MTATHAGLADAGANLMPSLPRKAVTALAVSCSSNASSGAVQLAPQRHQLGGSTFHDFRDPASISIWHNRTADEARVRPIQGEFCAEVIGADLARPMDDATFSEIERAWTRHSILVVPRCRMSLSHIAFTALGPLHIHGALQYNLEGHPRSSYVSNVEESSAT